jgi:hypothetical protein
MNWKAIGWAFLAGICFISAMNVIYLIVCSGPPDLARVNGVFFALLIGIITTVGCVIRSSES